MPIRVVCKHCGKQFSAWDDLIGKAVKCPKCQQQLEIQDEHGGEQVQCDKCGANFPSDDHTKKKSSHIFVICPRCGKRSKAPAAYRGKTARCKACDARHLDESDQLNAVAFHNMTGWREDD